MDVMEIYDVHWNGIPREHTACTNEKGDERSDDEEDVSAIRKLRMSVARSHLQCMQPIRTAYKAKACFAVRMWIEKHPRWNEMARPIAEYILSVSFRCCYSIC